MKRQSCLEFRRRIIQRLNQLDVRKELAQHIRHAYIDAEDDLFLFRSKLASEYFENPTFPLAQVHPNDYLGNLSHSTLDAGWYSVWVGWSLQIFSRGCDPDRNCIENSLFNLVKKIHEKPDGQRSIVSSPERIMPGIHYAKSSTWLYAQAFNRACYTEMCSHCGQASYKSLLSRYYFVPFVIGSGSSIVTSGLYVFDSQV